MESGDVSLVENCGQDATFVIMDKDMGELMPAFNLAKPSTNVMLPSIPDAIKSEADQLLSDGHDLDDKSENLDNEN